MRHSKDNKIFGLRKGHKINVGRKLSKTIKKKIAKSNKGKNKGKQYTKHWLGKNRSDKTKEKISRTKTGRPCSSSTKFKRGKENPNWKGGISFNPYAADWTKTLRRSIRERDNYVCQLCGKLQGDRAFCVHHIDYDKENCNPDNLITLCNRCNSKVNSNREFWTEYFSILKNKTK